MTPLLALALRYQHAARALQWRNAEPEPVGAPPLGQWTAITDPAAHPLARLGAAHAHQAAALVLVAASASQFGASMAIGQLSALKRHITPHPHSTASPYWDAYLATLSVAQHDILQTLPTLPLLEEE